MTLSQVLEEDFNLFDFLHVYLTTNIESMNTKGSLDECNLC